MMKLSYYIFCLNLIIVPTFGWNFINWVTDKLLNDKELSFQVSIHRSYNESFICSGAIIEQNLVITSSECLHYEWGGILPPFIVSILVNNSLYYNATNISAPFDDETTNKTNYLGFVHIEEDLDEIVSYSIKLSQSCICTVDGYFPSEKNDNEFIFKRIEVTVNECEEEGFLCASNSDENLCSIDRGSGLYCDISLIGILAMTEQCNTTNETLKFTRLTDTVCLNNAPKMLNNIFWLIISIKYILRI